MQNGNLGAQTKYSRDSKAEFRSCGNEKNLGKVCKLGFVIAGGVKQFVNFVVDEYMAKEERKILGNLYFNLMQLFLNHLRKFRPWILVSKCSSMV